MGKDYERICEWGNLYDAYLKARRGKRWKNSVAKVEASALEAVALIQRELQTRTYRPGGYRAFYVYEPKRRLIQTNSFKDKIVQHAFCDQVLYDALTKPLRISVLTAIVMVIMGFSMGYRPFIARSI